MIKDRPQLSPEDITFTLEGGDSFIETGSTFGDNFRFGAEALSKLARISDTKTLGETVQKIFDVIIHDKSEGDDVVDSLGLGIVHLAQLYKTFSQMGVLEVVMFVEQHRTTLLGLDLSREEWNRFAENKELPEAVAYNEALRSVAAAFLEINVTPWTLRRRT